MEEGLERLTAVHIVVVVVVVCSGVVDVDGD